MIKKNSKVSLARLLLTGATAMTLVGCASTPGPDSTDGEQTVTWSGSSNQPNIQPAKLDYYNVWDRVRAGLRMKPLDHRLVERHERWFAEHPEYTKRLVERASLYLYYIVEEVEKRGMPMEVALLPAIESAFKPHAYSRARAAGLWQFIRSTGRVYGLHKTWWYDARRDVIAATNAALNYLSKLNKDFDGDWQLSFAAYNAGEGRIFRARRYNARHNRPTTFEHLTRIKRETKHYVPKLVAFANVVRNPSRFGLELAPIANQPYFTSIDIGSQVDLEVLAKKANVPVGDLYDINPGFRRWATAPEGPYHLLVPIKYEGNVRTALADLPSDKRVKWARHRIRPGHTLGQIARRYGVSVSAIKRANRIRSNTIRAGHDLLIPMSTRAITARAGNVIKPRPRRVSVPKGRVAVIHEVSKGDTLWNIALKYKVYISQLVRWNPIHRRSTLKLGQKIKVWVRPENTGSGAKAVKLEQETLPSS